MKYIILFLALLADFSLAQETTITSGEYKLKTGGVIQVQTYGNQVNAKAAATKISQACGCRVDILQPVLTVTTTKASSSKSSVSSTASSVSVSSSSVAVSSAQAYSASASSLPVLQRATLSWHCPTLREDDTVLNEWDIEGYSLVLGDKPEIVLVATGCDMNHIVDAPQEGQIYKVATIAKKGGYSTYKPFE